MADKKDAELIRLRFQRATLEELLAVHEQAVFDRSDELDQALAALGERARQLDRAEEALEEAESRFRRLVESNIIGMIVVGSGGQITEANDNFLQALGWAREDLAAGTMAWEAMTPPEYRSLDESALNQLRSLGACAPWEKEFLRKGGGRVWALVGAIRLERTADTSLCFVLDITERKRAERLVAAQHAVTRVLAESPTLTGATPRILRAVCESVGWDVGAIWNVDHPANALRCVDVWHQPGARVAEFEALTRCTAFAPGIGLPGRVWSSGEPAWIPDVTRDSNFPRAPMAAKNDLHAAFGFPIQSGGRVTGVIEFFSREIRKPDNELLSMLGALGNQIGQFIERKRIEQSLRYSEARHRSLVVATSQIVWTTNADGEVVGDLPAWREFTGQSEQDIRGHGWMQAIHPDDREQAMRRWSYAVATCSLYETEYRLRDGDGGYRYFAVRGVPVIEGDAWATPYWQSPDFSLHGVPLVEDRSRVREWVVACTDITHRKEAEAKLQQTMAELARSNRDLEEFAHSVSHDLKEPLRMVSVYCGYLEQRYRGKLGPDADEFIYYATDGARRMDLLIEGLLEYSRVGTQGAALKPTDSGRALHEALANLRVAIRESGAEVTHGPLPTVLADTMQLARLFQNLIDNAIKFRSDQPPRVAVSAERHDSEWFFSVRDNGIGFETRHAERVFVVFQRLHTREEYPGTGIGLAICKRIVERHDGRIWVESQPGKGSVFCFTIPAR